MKGKAIILLSSVGNLPRALHRAGMDDTIIICLDEVARQVAQKYAKEHIHSVGEYLDLSETELRQRADEFSMLWYQANGKDYSTFEGLSTGELLIVEVTYKALFELEKMIVLIQKIIQVHQPTSWLLATNENPLFAQVIRAHANPAPIAQITPNRMAWARRNLNFRELKLWLRQNGWDYHFRAATFRLLNLLRKTAPPAKSERGRVLFILDIPTSSAMDTLLPVIKEVPPEERLILASDPRCYSLIQQAGLEGYPFSPEALNVPLPQKKLATSREIHQRWEGLRAEKEANGSQLVFRGVDLWDIRAPYFKNQFLRKIPIALAQFQLALAVLKTYQVRAIVSATDNHYMGQLFVRAAQTMNLYFLTIQHGMVNHPAGYLPIRGSQLAVMGEAVREWLITHGAPPEKVVVTGQPRFDALVTPPDLARETLLQELDLSPNRPTWLIAPEPQLGLWMRDLIFRTLERIPDVQAIIRVHPNDNPLDYQVSLNAYPPLLSRVRIARHHDIKSALNGCDVIVLGRSTIGLEALIMGKYPIVILPENSTGWILPPYLQDYLAIAPYLAANTPEGIAEAWKILCTQETSALDALRQKIVTQYACSNDGKNAYRVAQLLRKEIH